MGRLPGAIIIVIWEILSSRVLFLQNPNLFHQPYSGCLGSLPALPSFLILKSGGNPVDFILFSCSPTPNPPFENRIYDFYHFHLDRNMLWKVILLRRNNLPNVSHYFTLSVTSRVSVGNRCIFQLKYLDNTNLEERGSLFVNENCTVISVYNGETHVNDCLSSGWKKKRRGGGEEITPITEKDCCPSPLNILLSSFIFLIIIIILFNFFCFLFCFCGICWLLH